jgi:hypothetical protein
MAVAEGGVSYSDKLKQRESLYWQIILVSLVAAGILLRLRQYLFNRALWLDEASLANNVVDRSLLQLLSQRLEYDQSAPPGFLVVVDAIVGLFGPHEWALRMFPLAAGIVSIWLAYILAQRELRSLAARTTFVGLMAMSPLLIFYSVEFKQYSSDILFTLLIAIAYSCRSSRYGTLLLSVTGFVALLFSLPAFFVAAAAGLMMLYEGAKTSRWQRTFIVGFVWAAAAALHGLYHWHGGVDRGYMVDWWGERNGFAPLKITSLDDVLWYPQALSALVYQTFLGEGPIDPRMFDVKRFVPLRWLLTIVFVVAAIAALRTRKDIFVLALGTIALTALASALELYPFSSRLLIFLVPFIFLIVAAGVDEVDRRAGLVAAAVLFASLIVITAPRSVKLLREPAMISDTPAALEQVSKQFQAGDAVVGAKMNNILLHFYRRNLPEGAPVFTITTNDGANLITRLVKEQGFRRVWFVSVHGGTQVAQRIMDATERSAPIVFKWRTRGSRLALFDFSQAAPASGQ